jgi:indolepyruvate ferredoxin oxidoreductase beta subunit
MRKDIVLAGVGGQGVLCVAAIIAEAARREGLFVKQAEVHGMSQRGGAVQAFLRLADHPILSELVGEGTADMILGLEPLESLRYVHYLRPDGLMVTAIDPVENIPDYPNRAHVLAMLAMVPHVIVVEAGKLARQAGTHLAANTVIVGAAAHALPLDPATIEAGLRSGFAPKGEKVVEANVAAFRAGLSAVSCAPA